MNKQQLTDRLARESHRSRSQAADAVDSFVYQLLKDLRTNNSLPLPEPTRPPADAPSQNSDSEKEKS